LELLLLLEGRTDDATSLAGLDEVIGCNSKRSCSSFDWKQRLHRSLRQAFDSNDLQIDDILVVLDILINLKNVNFFQIINTFESKWESRQSNLSCAQSLKCFPCVSHGHGNLIAADTLEIAQHSDCGPTKTG
jgi:hypothetical protein